MSRKITTEQFIVRAKQQHGDRYDYSLVAYTGANNKVLIKCRVHGVFEQRAMDHIKGRGCASCKERQLLTTEMFIMRANQKHASKYQYGNVVYKNYTTKVRITCPQHGVFEQTPSDHLQGCGCPDCGGTKKITMKQFISRSRKVHGKTYQYSNASLVNMNVKTT